MAGKTTKRKTSKVIIDLAYAAGLEVFSDPEGEQWARVKVAGHDEYVKIHSGVFRAWLRGEYGRKNPNPANANAIEEVIQHLTASAINSKSTRRVYYRIAHSSGNIYIDLGRDDWKMVEVLPGGWRLINQTPIAFRRAAGMKALPVPLAGGNLNAFFDFLPGQTDKETRILILAWLLAAFSEGAYPVLVFSGMQGSGKSTFSRLLRSLIDPHEAAINAPPHDQDALLIAADNSWVLAYDNISNVPEWLSDSFCRLSTEGTMIKRKLYTDKEPAIFKAKRPLILNGITDFINRGDLMDRALVVSLPGISEIERKPESLFWDEFDQLRGDLFGAILDVLSSILKNLPNVQLDNLPRMADFARWVLAACPALDLPEDEFLRIYRGNQDKANTTILETSYLAIAITEFNKQVTHWEGTISELYKELLTRSYGTPAYDYFFKIKLHWLSAELRRLAPSLEVSHILIEFSGLTRKRGKPERLITIEDLTYRMQSAKVPAP